MTDLNPGDPVRHADLGRGVVVAVVPPTAVIRVDGRLEECPASELTLLRTPAVVSRTDAWDPALGPPQTSAASTSGSAFPPA